ncbi:alpha-N-acetylgalactosaminide alpha-2,6-sialyltransferase 2-like [Branchiostoma lanceolatum]|uniref:alpha-N-acetylgalactosaminide alpha-2,6-sialyltransferase 2-like n=1 Tax=Branchiostoma lanceolatum TaxID=7740 RepID=UPI0034552DA1
MTFSVLWHCARIVMDRFKCLLILCTLSVVVYLWMSAFHMRPSNVLTTPSLRGATFRKQNFKKRVTIASHSKPTIPPDNRSEGWFLHDDTYTRSKCPSVLRQSPEKLPPGLKLIRDAPVLMWNEHINPEEYSRLKQFDRSYGWKSVPYDAISSNLQHFDSPAHRYLFPDWSPVHDVCITCAVVGNSGIMRGSGLGQEIDKHDFVFRVNAAITKGFEKDVGNRTSFYFHNINTMLNAQKEYRKYGFVQPPQDEETIYVSVIADAREHRYFDAAISWKPVKSGRDKSKTPPTQYGEKPASTKFRMTHPDFMRYLKLYWLNSTRALKGTMFRPTTGAAMLLTALHTCDVTDAYGFITADHGRYNNHYYEPDKQAVKFPPNHDYQLEIDLWDKLDKAGVMHLYRGKRHT